MLLVVAVALETERQAQAVQEWAVMVEQVQQPEQPILALAVAVHLAQPRVEQMVQMVFS